jgi:DNA-binding CsgD family transcriptional regulator
VGRGERHRYNNPVRLTKREIDVINCLFEYMTCGQVGEKLGISARTAETHRKNIYEKTHSSNLHEVWLKLGRDNFIMPFNRRSDIYDVAYCTQSATIITITNATG